MPKTYEPQWYQSPIALPEGTSGAFSVRHRILPVGAEVTIVGMRQGMLRGIRPVRGKIETPLRIHELREQGETGGGLWMTDQPEELNQIAEMLQRVQPRGAVLVGGLGLGIVAQSVAVWPGVTSTTVVERSRDVIRLCHRADGGYVTHAADIAEYLATTTARYDYILLDTWCGTNEGTWWEEVLPLRRLIRRRWGKHPIVDCWAEDIMHGQLFRTLTTCQPHWRMTYLPLPMSAYTAHRFLRDVGFPTWERRYGAAIDRYVTERAAEHAVGEGT